MPGSGLEQTGFNSFWSYGFGLHVWDSFFSWPLSWLAVPRSSRTPKSIGDFREKFGFSLLLRQCQKMLLETIRTVSKYLTLALPPFLQSIKTMPNNWDIETPPETWPGLRADNLFYDFLDDAATNPVRMVPNRLGTSGENLLYITCFLRFKHLYVFSWIILCKNISTGSWNCPEWAI